jgi:5'-phosphate synthase pdxT subunit
MKKVGVLALQGDVPEHRLALELLLPRNRVVLVRAPEDLEAVDALCLPGGESTTIARLLEESRLWPVLAGRLSAGLPVLATCAGLILLARRIEPSPGGRDPPTLGALDIRIRRNDYGRQRESFESPVRVAGLPGRPFPGVFIRSPRILEVGPQATPFAFRADEVVGVRSGPVWGLTFHPELSGDSRIHRAFLRATLAQTPAAKRNQRTARATRTRPTATAHR